VLRTACVLSILVVAIAVPNFGPVLSLLGGSFFTLLSVVFPILIYNKLAGDRITVPKKLFLAVIILITVTSAIGNGYIEAKNILKVIKGNYE